MHSGNHFGARAFRREDAEPLRRVEAGQSRLVQRRNLRHRREASLRGEGDDADAAGPVVRNERRRAEDADRHLAADEILHRRPAAFVGHVNHVDARHLLEELPGHVLAASRARMGERELARIRLGIRDELLHGLHGQRRMNCNRDGLRGDLRDGAEIALHVELHVLHDEMKRNDRIGDEQKRVAVGRRPRGFHRADRAAAPAAVVHDDLLAERARQLFRERARGDVGRAAGRERHDEAHRARRPGLCFGERAEQKQTEEELSHIKKEFIWMR
jgi:hypothetical protein